MSQNTITYPVYSPGHSVVSHTSSILVSLHRGGPCMRFDARFLPNRRIFIESDFLYNAGKALYLVVGDPQESHFDVLARVQSVQYGDDGSEQSGMLLALERPGLAA